MGVVLEQRLSFVRSSRIEVSFGSCILLLPVHRKTIEAEIN